MFCSRANCWLFLFSSCWGPPNLWEEFVHDFKHVQFEEDLLDINRANLPGFLYDDEIEKTETRVIGSVRNGVVMAEQRKCYK